MIFMHPNLTIKILIWKVNLLLFWENFNRHDTMNMNESSSDEINLETMLAFACQLTLNIQMVFFLYIFKFIRFFGKFWFIKFTYIIFNLPLGGLKDF